MTEVRSGTVWMIPEGGGDPVELKGVTNLNFEFEDDEPDEKLSWPEYPLTVEIPIPAEDAARMLAFLESIWGPVETWPMEDEDGQH